MGKILDKMNTNSSNAWKSATEGKNLGSTISGVAGGITGVVKAGLDNAQIADTSGIHSSIEDTANTDFSANSYDSLLSTYNPFAFQSTSYTGDDVRGLSDGEIAMNTISGALNGAAAGAQVGGIWGAIGGTVAGLGSGIAGWLVGDKKAQKEADALNAKAEAANKQYMQNFALSASNIGQGMFNTAALNLAAEGGQLDMYDRSKVHAKNFRMKNRKSKYKGFGNYYAYGGQLMSGDWSNGVVMIDEGDTHERNPLGGVLMGIDPQGIPNLVEEGEVIFNDYVYSNRLKPTKKQLEDMHIDTKFEGKTYAEIVKIIQEESSLRPLDNISKNTLIDGLSKLTILQEETRMKKERAKMLRTMRRMLQEGEPEAPQNEQMSMGMGMGMQDPNAQMEMGQQQIPQDEHTPRAYTGIREEMPEMYARGGFLANYFDDGSPIKTAKWNKYATGDYPYYKDGAYTQEFLDYLKGLTSADAEVVDALFKQAYANYKDSSTGVARYIRDYTSPEKLKTEDIQRLINNALLQGEPGSLAQIAAVGFEKANSIINKGDLNRINIDTQPLEQPETAGLASPTMFRWEDTLSELPKVEVGFNSDKSTKSRYEKILSMLPKVEIDFNSDKTEDVVSEQVVEPKPEKVKTERVRPERKPRPERVRKERENWLSTLFQNRGASKAAKDSVKSGDVKKDNPEDVNTYLDMSDYPDTNIFQYAPTVGSAINLMLRAFDKPDYTNAENLEKAARGIRNISYSPIGGYAEVNPYDVNFEQTKLRNQTLGNIRNLLNATSGNRGAAIPTLLYYNQQGVAQEGDILNEALKFNDDNYFKVLNHNAEINKFNAQQAMTASQSNQSADARKLDYLVKALELRKDEDTLLSDMGSSAATALFNNLGVLGKNLYASEQEQYMLKNGYIPGVGYITSNKQGQAATQPQTTPADTKDEEVVKARGGKLRKRMKRRRC